MVVARVELMDSITANSISTFGGNPLVASGALAVLDFLAAHDLQGNARVVGARLGPGCGAWPRAAWPWATSAARA